MLRNSVIGQLIVWATLIVAGASTFAARSSGQETDANSPTVPAASAPASAETPTGAADSPAVTSPELLPSDPAETPPAVAQSPEATAGDVAPAETVQQAYVGTGKCLICHRPQTNSYTETKHAKAFENLPEKYRGDQACLKCHVTGFGQPEGFVADTEKDLRMVGCEACHGPGAKHLDAANRFILANPGEEAAIEKDLKTTIVKTPDDSVCIGCHEMQSHRGHPGFEGSKLQGALTSTAGPCPPGMIAGATPASFPPNPLSRFTVKTCGGCHYDQYKHWRVEKHSDLTKSLPPKYADDQTCKECHAAPTGVPPTASLSEELKKQWAGLVCEKCHGPALPHVNFNKQFLASVTYSPKLEAAARDSIRKSKPTSLCIQCHTRIGHKQHVAFEAN